MKPEKRTWPSLFKRTVGGKAQSWEIWVEKIPEGGRIFTRYGLTDGKRQTLQEDITEGKNLGRSNETSPFAQAVLEAEAAWKQNLERKGYGLTVEASAETRSRSPMLALPYGKHAKKVDWVNAYVQPKLDGFRCLAVATGAGVLLFSRENKPIVTMPHIVEALEAIMEEGEVVDGELYAHYMPFQRIASAVKRVKTAAEHADQIRYHVYDAQSDLAFKERYAVLEKKIGSGASRLALVQTVRVRNYDDLVICQKEHLEAGYEGSMLRHGRTGYEAGKRSSSLLKVKTFRDDEFKVVDYKEGRGTHKGMAIFVCETDKGHHFDVTAPGTHEQKREYLARGAEFLNRELTVKYQELSTSAEPVPRFPVAIRFRDE